MTKGNKIVYWIASCWLALGMLSTGFVQLISMDEEVKNFTHLGYPVYLAAMLGIWKILGVIAIMVPGLPVLKEWAYAGFFFAMSGALISHIITGNGIKELFGPALLLMLTMVSWYFRPANSKPVLVKSYK